MLQLDLGSGVYWQAEKLKWQSWKWKWKQRRLTLSGIELLWATLVKRCWWKCGTRAGKCLQLCLLSVYFNYSSAGLISTFCPTVTIDRSGKTERGGCINGQIGSDLWHQSKSLSIVSPKWTSTNRPPDGTQASKHKEWVVKECSALRKQFSLVDSSTSIACDRERQS